MPILFFRFILFTLLILSIFHCSDSNIEKINKWNKNEDFIRLLEFSKKNKLNEEEIYLSSVAVSKLQNKIRKNISERKYSNPQYFKELEKTIGLKVEIFNTGSGRIIRIEDNYSNSLSNSEYYKNKSILEKFSITANTNLPYENNFLLMEILDIDPRLFLGEFKNVWIESMKLGITSNLSEEGKNKFFSILHFLASKEDANFKNFFYRSEGENINLRSGPGMEYSSIGKLNEEEVFQLDSDFKNTSIANKTGKWIQIYAFKSNFAGWIFSSFLKKSKMNELIANEYEKILLERTKHRAIDFNNWEEEEIPNGFYGSYSRSKKEILDAKIGFSIYSSNSDQEICSKISSNFKKITVSFVDQSESERILILSLKAIINRKPRLIGKVGIAENELFLNLQKIPFNSGEKKLQIFQIKLLQETESNFKISLDYNSLKTNELFNLNKEEIESWEICIPQGNHDSKRVLLFSLNIF